jgi:hypothetical protein
MRLVTLQIKPIWHSPKFFKMKGHYNVPILYIYEINRVEIESGSELSNTSNLKSPYFTIVL